MSFRCTQSLSSLLLLLIFLLLLPGCMRAAGPSSLGEAEKLGDVPAAYTPAGSAQPLLTFGIIYPMAHPFYEMITEFAKEAAASHSVQLTVKATDENSLEQQIRMMETMIKQQVDGIAIHPVDPEALTPFINKAVQAGIPVLCFETDAPGSLRSAFIGPDPLLEGHFMGELIKRELGGRGMIIASAGLSRSEVQQRRLEGILDYLNEHSDIQTLEVRYHEGSGAEALTNLEQMIEDHPHFDALVTLDMLSSSSSILVWKASGLQRSALTFGLTPEVKEALVNGQITSVISGNEQEWGRLIVENLLLASQGQAPAEWINTGIQVLSEENKVFD